MPKETIPKDIWVTAQDGLKLHVRQWGPQAASALSVVCLPGLARTVADFDPLATAIAGHAASPRRVLALDSRGRGKSQYDRNPENYNLNVELADLLAVLTALDVGEAIFVGTSRGGILAMRLAAVRPTAIAGCVLNDIGPVIEPKGLARIKGYVGKLPALASFPAAAEALKRRFGSQFPKWSDDDWLAFARATFKEDGGRLVPDYDPKLATILEAVGPARPLPTLWSEFDALGRAPVMVIRGANSDILSAATVEGMRKRRRALEVLEVPEEGHAPRLAGALTIDRIAGFIASCRDREAGPYSGRLDPFRHCRAWRVEDAR
jgi:pimeloyl-ACP methyl ester carboxylesterase